MCPQPYFLPEKMVAHFVIEQTLHEPGVCFQNRKTENSVPFLQQKILMPSAPPPVPSAGAYKLGLPVCPFPMPAHSDQIEAMKDRTQSDKDT